MAIYDMTNITEANTSLQMLVGVNEISNNYIGLFFLITLFFVIFIVFKQRETDTIHTLLIDSTLCTIVGLLMWSINLLSWSFLLLPIIGIFASAIILKLRD
jgi:predicted branched-subunit amino acid permease